MRTHIQRYALRAPGIASFGARFRACCAVALLALLAACGGGEGGGAGGGGFPGFVPPSQQPSDPNAPVRAVGGSVVGLAGSGLVLQNNGGNDLPINADGSFRFSQGVAKGTSYLVTVKTQPANPAQICTVNNAAGTMGDVDIDGVRVTCSTRSFSVGGTVSGLRAAGLVLQNNAGDDVGVGADGNFTFAAPVASGANYAVTVKTQPAGLPAQTCTVNEAGGIVAGADVTGVRVVCAGIGYPVSVTVSGLDGQGFVLQNNFGDDLEVTANGVATFRTPVASGGHYVVFPKSQPRMLGQTCTVTDGIGTVVNAPVSGIAVQCTTLSKSSYLFYLLLASEAGSLVEVSGIRAGMNTTITTVGSTPQRTASVVAPAVGARAFSVTTDGAITSYTVMDMLGMIIVAPGSTTRDVGGPAALAAHPNGQYLYAAGENGRLMSFGGAGSMTPIGDQNVASLGGPAIMTVDPLGRFVYLAKVNGSEIVTYRIGADGALVVPGVPTPASGVTEMAVDPSGRYLYAATDARQALRMFPVNATEGRLAEGVPVLPTNGARISFGVDPRGRYLWLADDGGKLSAHKVGADGGLALESQRDIAGVVPGGLGFNAEGTRLFVTNTAGESNWYAYQGNSVSAAGMFTNRLSTSSMAIVSP